MLISATGRLFAAFNGLDDKALRREFDKLVWDSPPTWGIWREEVAQSRAQGYACDQGAYISGVTVVAVPVFGANGLMIRSLVAIGITERLQNGEIPALATALIELRDEIQTMQVDTGS